MARVVVPNAAEQDLRQLISSRNLPDDTPGRFQRSLRPLETFPELGPELGGSFAGRRFMLGPWRWLIAVYQFYPEQDMIAILAVVDARTSNSPTANR